jgi:hypothetical protein
VPLARELAAAEVVRDVHDDDARARLITALMSSRTGR